MTLIEAIKKDENNLRVSANSNKWLIWDDVSETWVVYERIRFKTITKLETRDEEEAVEELLNDS